LIWLICKPNWNQAHRPLLSKNSSFSLDDFKSSFHPLKFKLCPNDSNPFRFKYFFNEIGFELWHMKEI
jgi:hypothetical protein